MACFNDVDEFQSPIRSSDEAAFAAQQRDPALQRDVAVQRDPTLQRDPTARGEPREAHPFREPVEAHIVQRSGGVALLRLDSPPAAHLIPGDMNTTQSKPASLLIVKGEAGWRLREIYADRD
ncbi:hypothetical protein BH09ACT6_BH09ACT6_18850 [soil metagenome]